MMVYYRSDDDLFEDIYNFDDINNRRKVEDYSVRPNHHHREEKRAITRLPPVNSGRNLVSNRARACPSYQASNLNSINAERRRSYRNNFTQESRRMQNIPRGDQRTTRLPSAAPVTTHVTQAQGGYHRQNENTNYEKEYIQLMEGVADKSAFEKSPQVIEYERKNKLERRKYQKMFVSKPEHKLPLEDIFSRKVHEYETRNQINKTDNASQGQNLPRVSRNF